MGGWRRAFCTTVPKERERNRVTDNNKQQSHSSPTSGTPSPRNCTKLGLFSGGSNPTTPRLHSPVLRCRTTNTAEAPPSSKESSSSRGHTKSPPKNLLPNSNPSSPRSPLKLSLFRNSFKFRSSCGICLNSVKTGQGTAIYTAECGHAFHFPCIAAHVRKQGSLVCPVCNVNWKDVPLLAIHKSDCQNDGVAVSAAEDHNNIYNNAITTTPTTPKIEDKKVLALESSPRAIKTCDSPSPRAFQPFDSRSYDDDEPLISPGPGGRFIPIPEADEEEEDDGEEFQGFFVNPSPSSDNELLLPINGGDCHSRNVHVRLLPEAAVVSSSRGYETYAVALRVKAPPPAQTASNQTTTSFSDTSHRAPIDLVTVLDVSGSMAGAKLHMLKRAMRLVISSLGSADRLSIVAFSGVSKRLLPLSRMTAQGQRAARRIVDRLVCGQGTSVGEALRKATKVLEDRRERNPVATIILLSDGHGERIHSNNNANQRHGSSHVSSTRFAHIEIPVHSFGFGGYTHEPAVGAFAKCVGGLLSVVVRDLRVQLSFSSGSAPAEILAVYSSEDSPAILGSGSVRLGDMYAEEERELLVELRVPCSAVASHHVMSVRCLYKDPATQEVVYGRDQALLVPRPHAVQSSDPKIERLRSLFIFTRAVAEARRLVEHKDFTSAHHLLESSRALLLQLSWASAEDYVKGLEVEMAEVHWRKTQVEQQHVMMMMMQQQQRRRGSDRDMMMTAMDENGDPLTPTSAWRAAEKLAKVAMMKKSLHRVSDLHGFENARF